MEATQGAGITYYPPFSTFGKVMCLQGHYDVGLSSLARSVSELRAVGNRPFEAHSQIYLSDAYLELGRLEEARELATNGLRTARDINQPGAVVDGLTSLALYMHAVNDDDAAERMLEEAVKIATQAKIRFELTTALTAVARAQLGTGNIRKAADSATRSYGLAIDGRFRIYEAGALLILAIVQHHDGHQTEAISMAERALKIALETGYRFGEAEAHGVLAALYADARRAAEHAEAAARIYQQTGARPPRALLSSPHLADHHRDIEGNSLNRRQRGEG